MAIYLPWHLLGIASKRQGKQSRREGDDDRGTGTRSRLLLMA
jgi:hypothetical protein